MKNGMDEISREEMEKLLEKAKADMQAMLDKMTPEERAQAEARAQKIIAEDQAEKQSLLYDAAKYAAGQTAPRFCKHCGAESSGGKICEYCGMPL